MEQNGPNYDKAAVGQRIRDQRKRLGISRSEMAEHIGRAEKYYADIERGYCGMSVETMICIADTLGLSLDYLILGKGEGKEVPKEAKSILVYLGSCSEKRRKKAVELLQLYLSE